MGKNKDKKKKKQKQYKLKEIVSFAESDEKYFNRELSLLKFSERVLHEAENPENPLMERVKYLSIVGGNLDEFFSVRVPPYQRSKHGLVDEFTSLEKTKDQLEMVYFRTIYLMRSMAELWNSKLVPELKKEGISFLEWDELSDTEKESMMQLLSEQVFNVYRYGRNDDITKANLCLSGIVFIVELGSQIAIVPVQDVIDKIGRILPVGKSGDSFIFIEKILNNYIEKLFVGEDVYALAPYRITRDADMDIKGDDAEDLYEALKKAKEELPYNPTSRLEVLETTPYGYVSLAVKPLELKPELVYDYKEPLGIKDVGQFSVKDSNLYYPPFTPTIPDGLEKEGIFESIAEKDRIQFTPFHSFDGMLNFLNAAAEDPDVLEISMTLYRLGSKSPVADALIAAAKRGAKVTVVIELKASFDEERNFNWTEQLRNAGVNVIHGVARLKTHGKCCLVTRREGRKKVRYGTVSTGNYNAKTAGLYTDLSIFTADKRITTDLAELFDMLKREETNGEFKHLLISPEYMENGVLSLIKKEIAAQKANGTGRIIMKMNSLTDKTIIDALYAASSAGVKVTLLVRGVCMLRPGVPNLSENITVLSTVGRFLEHARVYIFGSTNDVKIYIGSADMMARNLVNRVEILCPIYDSEKKDFIVEVMRTYIEDKGGSYYLDGFGRYSVPKEGKKRAQDIFIEKLSQTD